MAHLDVLFLELAQTSSVVFGQISSTSWRNQRSRRCVLV